MSKRNNNYERNPLKMVIYIFAVLFLLGCIGYLLLCSGRDKEAYHEEVKKASALESSAGISQGEQAEEQQEETSTEENKTASVTAKLTATPTAAVSPELTETPGLTTTPAPAAENEASETGEVDKNVGILVLNGTKRPGVAAYWKTQLETAGYANVVPATYNKTVGQETVIYAPSVEVAKPFLELFPNAAVQVGNVADGIELQAGVVMPENCQVYIVIGNKDVSR